MHHNSAKAHTYFTHSVNWKCLVPLPGIYLCKLLHLNTLTSYSVQFASSEIHSNEHKIQRYNKST